MRHSTFSYQYLMTLILLALSFKVIGNVRKKKYFQVTWLKRASAGRVKVTYLAYIHFSSGMHPVPWLPGLRFCLRELESYGRARCVVLPEVHKTAINELSVQFSHSVVSDFATPWTAARQLPCPSPTSGLLKLMSMVLVMPSNHLILCRPLLLLPSVFPSIRVFSSESTNL